MKLFFIKQYCWAVFQALRKQSYPRALFNVPDSGRRYGMKIILISCKPCLREGSKICFVQKDIKMTSGREEVCEYDVFLPNYLILISMYAIF